MTLDNQSDLYTIYANFVNYMYQFDNRYSLFRYLSSRTM